MPMSPNADYRPLAPADVKPAARVIAQAFIDDPLCAFMLPLKSTRTGTLYTFFCALGELSIRQNRGFGVGQPLQGVAYWKFPDQGDVSVSLGSLGRFAPLLFTLYPLGYIRARAILRQIEAFHQQHADQPHFYLDNIGVLPAARGRGVASRLIRPFLAMADRQRVITYTDTVTRSNVALYEHFGFECVDERTVPGTGITVWALRRPVH